MQCVYLFMVVFGGGFLFISFILGEVGHVAEDVSGGVVHALDNVLEHIGIDFLHDAHIGDHDAQTEHVSPLSFRNMMAFITFFGAMGMFSVALHWPTIGGLLASAAVGVTSFIASWKFTQAIARQSASTHATNEDIIGQDARVTVAITQDGLGQVVLVVKGVTEEWGARSEDGQPLPGGTDVQIVDRKGGILTVKKG